MNVNRKRKAEGASAPNTRSWTEHDGSLLIRLVRQCQKQGSSGVHGEWKTFLKVLALVHSYHPTVLSPKQ